MAVSSAVKILDIVGKLVENVSFELRKTAAAETLFELLEPSVKICYIVKLFYYLVGSLFCFSVP